MRVRYVNHCTFDVWDTVLGRCGWMEARLRNKKPKKSKKKYASIAEDAIEGMGRTTARVKQIVLSS
jgi:hypothetical protein